MKHAAAAVCIAAAASCPAFAQTKWVGPEVYFCPTPKLSLAIGQASNAETCTSAPPGSRVEILGNEKDSIGRIFIKVRMGDRIGYISDFEFERAQSEDPKVVAERERRAAAAQAERRRKQELLAAIAHENDIEAQRAECSRRGQPAVGMTPAQATETCWRQPRRIVKKTTAAGVSEDYIYSIGHILRFQDGLLSEVIETR